MTRFIATREGLINLDYVVKIVEEPIAELRGWVRFAFIDTHERVLGTTQGAGDQLDYLKCRYVPAQPGFKALHYGRDDSDPTEVPVIAWSEDGALGADGRHYTVVEWPDGRVFGEDCIHC